MRFPPFLDAKALRPVRATQGRETLVGDAASAGHELQESQASLVVESLERQPEPLDHLMHVVVSWGKAKG